MTICEDVSIASCVRGDEMNTVEIGLRMPEMCLQCTDHGLT